MPRARQRTSERDAGDKDGSRHMYILPKMRRYVNELKWEVQKKYLLKYPNDPRYRQGEVNLARLDWRQSTREVLARIGIEMDIAVRNSHMPTNQPAILRLAMAGAEI